MAKVSRTVPDSLAGARLDKAIVVLVEGASRARVKRAIESGEVRLNGRSVAKGGVVSAGDVIDLDDDVSSAEGACVAEPDAPLEVRHQSPKVLVVEKVAGRPTAPLRGGETGTLANALLGHHPELAGVGYTPREPGLLHRLDTETSGLVVVARTKEAFEALREALQTERLEKEYLLVCASEGLPDHGSIEMPIANHPKDKKRVYVCVHPRDVMRYAPRPAATRFDVQKRSGAWALVRAHAPRAVRHQIRAHFAELGHPLAGDDLYGGPKIEGLTRHALHASRVAFDGAGDAALTFDVTSPPPEDLARLVP
jgi:23S rRNA pseudouridine1911/1915/1917 synthase